MFEGDHIWWKPLELTFNDWKDKIVVIPKYVSDCDNDQYISLNTFLKENNFKDEKIFIKMDIEGYEETVLRGCSEALKGMNQEGVDLTMAVCCYHKQTSEEEIRTIITETGIENIKVSKGFLILNNFCEERIYPYFRRGILFASTRGKE